MSLSRWQGAWFGICRRWRIANHDLAVSKAVFLPWCSGRCDFQNCVLSSWILQAAQTRWKKSNGQKWSCGNGFWLTLIFRSFIKYPSTIRPCQCEVFDSPDLNARAQACHSHPGREIWNDHAISIPDLNMEVSWNRGAPLVIIHFNVFNGSCHYQPLSTIHLGVPPFLEIPGLTQRSWLHVVRTYLRPVLLLHLPWLPCRASNDACNDAPLPASSKRSAHLACQLSHHFTTFKGCVWLRYLSTICTKQWFPPCFG